MMCIRNRRWKSGSIFAGLLLCCALLLASCDSGGGGRASHPSSGSKGCTKVGILLPDTTSSDRWETKDHPLLVQAVKDAIPSVQIDYTNAHDNSDTQLHQAQTDLANGDCILVVAAHDSVAAASIVALAHAQNVPVIAYDRLIQSHDLNYYVSFDGAKVGALQGQYIADHYQQYQKGGKVAVALISGSQTDSNALLFSMGLHSVLDPLFADGSLKNVYETFTPDWNNSTAQSEAEAVLTDQQNNVQIMYVANDGMANNVLAALRAVNLSGKVLVTGQDATIAGIHNILTGEQNMTVYKPIAKEAQSVGSLVQALYNGADINALTNGATVATFDGGNIPAVLDAPITVDRSNIVTTVIADNYITKDEVCVGIAKGTMGVC